MFSLFHKHWDWRVLSVLQSCGIAQASLTPKQTHICSIVWPEKHLYLPYKPNPPRRIHWGGWIWSVGMSLSRFMTQAQKRMPINSFLSCQVRLHNVQSGLKYNEASKCNFVWHATPSIIHVEGNNKRQKRFPWSTNSLFWASLVMAAMNILALVKSFVSLRDFWDMSDFHWTVTMLTHT